MGRIGADTYCNRKLVVQILVLYGIRPSRDLSMVNIKLKYATSFQPKLC